MSAEAERKIDAIYEALVVDKSGDTDAGWSTNHLLRNIRRSLVTGESIKSPGGPQKQWTLFHHIDWQSRAISTLLELVKQSPTEVRLTDDQIATLREGLGDEVVSSLGDALAR